MFRNYFIIALRSLQKNGIYSFINIAGLSIGMACSILILLWVGHEVSFDNFHKQRDNIYRVYINSEADNGITTQMAVPLPLWDAFQQERDVVRVVPTDWSRTFLLTVGNQRLYKTGYYAGDDFLHMFSFPVLQGNPARTLSDPSSIVITTSTARALFGSENALGKTIRVDNATDMTVTAVVADVPGNSSFEFDCLLPFTNYMKREPWVEEARTAWGNNSFNLYIQLAEGADINAFEQRVKGLIKKNQQDSNQEITFLAMPRWRLYADFQDGQSVSGTIVYVRLFTILAVFILVIACINFMNLATARSERRAREVGIRKSIGSRRKELVFQFLGETFLIATMALIIAIGVVEGALPFYNMLVNKTLSISYRDPWLWTAALGIVGFTGLLAGSYPAFYLSAFQPAQVLKGRVHAGRQGAMPRKVMVTVQFFLSITLIACTIIIYRQIDHLRNRPVGYEQAQLMLIQDAGDIMKHYDAIKQSLLDQRVATYVTTSSSPVTAIYAYMGGISWPGKRDDQRAGIATIGIGDDYVSTLGMQILEGRACSQEHADSTAVMLNEAAVEYMGLTKPVGTVLTWNDKPYTVVGVVRNVVMVSPTRNVDPTVYHYSPTWVSDLTLRLPKEGNMSAVIPKIENIFKKYNPAYPFTYRFADDEFAKKFASLQLIGNLANLFAVLSILISCLGLFGLTAFTAEQRTKEIGIRKVLGASIPQVVVLLSREFTLLILVAFTLAAPLAWWYMYTWLDQFAYHTSIPWYILGGAGLLSLVLALSVVSYQAVRAALSNPVNALRSE